MLISTRTRRVEIPDPVITRYLRSGQQYTTMQRIGIREAYEDGARAVLKALEQSHGGRLEAAYLSDGRQLD